MNMRSVLAVVVALALGACTTLSGTAPTPAQQVATTQALWTQKCIVWSSMQPFVTKKLATMAPASVEKVIIAAHALDASCATLPANPQQAVISMTQELTTISILAAIPETNP